MTEQATLAEPCPAPLPLGADRPACRPDRPDADPSGRGRDPRAVGPAAPSPYRRDAPLGLLSPTAATSRRPCDAATHHLRDWRDNTQLPVDPKLLDLLWSLRAALDTSGPDPGVLRLPLARDQRHAAPHPPWRRPPQPAHAGDGDRPAGGGPPAAQRPPCRRGAQKAAAWATIRAPASSTSTRATSATGEPSGPGVPFRARPAAASSEHGAAGLTSAAAGVNKALSRSCEMRVGARSPLTPPKACRAMVASDALAPLAS